MIKKVGILFLVVFLLLVSLNPSPVRAEGELSILDSSAQADFPYQLKFSLSAESNYDINNIRLRYSVERTGFAEVVSETYIEFIPSTIVNVEWNLELVMIGGLPPGSGIEYWWLVEDTGGNRIETTPVQVRFDDNRYSWRSLSEGKVTIYWYEGDDSFASDLMAATHEALDRLDDNSGASLKKEVSIYVYADSAAVQGAMINPQEWTGGVAFTRYGTIAIGISPDNIDWGRRAIAHELTHLVVHQVTLNPYSGIPAWLDEGLAMYSEGPPESWYSSYLNSAAAEDRLISVRSLASPFSAYTEEARLSYAQSYNLVKFLIESYGRDKMLQLLQTFGQGSTYDGALEQVYGFDMDGLDVLWQDYIGVVSVPAAPVVERRMPPPLVGLLAGLATGLLAWLALVIEN